MAYTHQESKGINTWKPWFGSTMAVPCILTSLPTLILSTVWRAREISGAGFAEKAIPLVFLIRNYSLDDWHCKSSEFAGRIHCSSSNAFVVSDRDAVCRLWGSPSAYLWVSPGSTVKAGGWAVHWCRAAAVFGRAQTLKIHVFLVS